MATIPLIDLQTTVKIRNQFDTAWGTGFVLLRPDTYDYDNPQIHDEEAEMQVWIVTCAHVIDTIEASQIGSQQTAYIEANLIGGGVVSMSDPIGSTWVRHEGWVQRCRQFGPITQRPYLAEDAAVDVAVRLVKASQPWTDVENAGFTPSEHFTKARIAKGELGNGQLPVEGTPCFIVGFSSGFYPGTKNWPVVRQCIVAQIQPYLHDDTETFLVDGSVFAGNSGGPVFVRHDEQTQLIGMVSGHQLNPLTGENADLGMVIPLDTINAAIDTALRSA